MFFIPEFPQKPFQQSPQSITPRTPLCLFIWLLCCLKLVAFASRHCVAPTIRLKWRHFLQLCCHPSFQRPPLQHEAEFLFNKKGGKFDQPIAVEVFQTSDIRRIRVRATPVFCSPFRHPIIDVHRLNSTTKNQSLKMRLFQQFGEFADFSITWDQSSEPNFARVFDT